MWGVQLWEWENALVRQEHVKVDVLGGGQVKCGTRGSFDVTHECGRDNLMALHDAQVSPLRSELHAL